MTRFILCAIVGITFLGCADSGGDKTKKPAKPDMDQIAAISAAADQLLKETEQSKSVKANADKQVNQILTRGGTKFCEISLDGEVWIDGEKVGGITSDGEIWVGGNKEGELTSDGEVWKAGDKVGEVTEDLEVWRDGDKVGEIDKDGTVWIDGSSEGTTRDGDPRRAAVLFFFDFYSQ